jgi:hypothetical protein
MKPRRQRRRPFRKLKDKIVTALTLSGFLAGLLKYVNDIPAFIKAAEDFIEAPIEDRFEKFIPLGRLLWPILVDMTKLKASENHDLVALNAQLEAQGFDGKRLAKIWEILGPIALPLLLKFLTPKAG